MSKGSSQRVHSSVEGSRLNHWGNSVGGENCWSEGTQPGETLGGTPYAMKVARAV